MAFPLQPDGTLTVTGFPPREPRLQTPGPSTPCLGVDYGLGRGRRACANRQAVPGSPPPAPPTQPLMRHSRRPCDAARRHTHPVRGARARHRPRNRRRSVDAAAAFGAAQRPPVHSVPRAHRTAVRANRAPSRHRRLASPPSQRLRRRSGASANVLRATRRQRAAAAAAATAAS
eukprot:365773-Chlamydomonas_euryale.AAC.5